jgi:TDG/mug DNA glycosylase family protein
MEPGSIWKPTARQLAAATSKRLPDLLGPNLSVVFCGINPGLYSAAIGHHFGRPGNRFWPTLHASGFTPRLFTGFDDHQLLALGFGATNIVARTTASADQLSRDELLRGARSLRRKLVEHQPRFVAILGITAFRTAFQQPKAVGGLQAESIGATRVWVLPNPSGLNAHHPPVVLKRLFTEFREFADVPRAT